MNHYTKIRIMVQNFKKDKFVNVVNFLYLLFQ